jgi:3-deoxy-D-manno-octulosonic-acid transferase
MGEMMAYYAASDVVFIGGSLLPLGGQNLIEPIAVGRPTVVGPHMFNFAAATDAAQEAGVAIGVADADELVRTLNTLLADPQRRVAIGAAALAFHATHRGATDRLWAWLAPRLDAALARTAAR